MERLFGATKTSYCKRRNETLFTTQFAVTLGVLANIVAIGKPERQVRKASHCGSKHNRDHSSIASSRHIYISVLFFAHISFVVNHTFNAT